MHYPRRNPAVPPTLQNLIAGHFLAVGALLSQGATRLGEDTRPLVRYYVDWQSTPSVRYYDRQCVFDMQNPGGKSYEGVVFFALIGIDSKYAQTLLFEGTISLNSTVEDMAKQIESAVTVSGYRPRY
jgi:hypothetical protein